MLPLVAGVVGLVLVAMAGVPVAGSPSSTGDGPTDLLRAVGIPERNQVLALEAASSGAGDEVTWTLDASTHVWQRRAAKLPSVAGLGLLAHVPGSDDVLAVPRSPGAVWSLNLNGGTWRALAVPRARPVDVTDIAVDVRRAVVLAWSDEYDELWSYDPSGNRWSKVPRREPWPSAAIAGNDSGYTLMTYDSAADRAVLAVLPLPGRSGVTWVFDPGTQRWTRQASTPPPIVLGYGEWGTEAAFDTIHRRTVLFSRGVVATYDARRDRWQVPISEDWPALTFGPDPGLESFDGENPWPTGQPIGALSRSDHQLVPDPAAGRILVLGGVALFDVPGAEAPWDVTWRPVRQVWAYDVGVNAWTRMTD